MSPSAEQLLLEQLERMENRQIEQGQSIAKIEGKMDEQDRYCGNCKQENCRDHGLLFAQVNEIQLSRAQNAGIRQGQEQAEEKRLGNWQKYLAIGASGLAAGGSLVGLWPTIKQWLIAIMG